MWVYNSGISWPPFCNSMLKSLKCAVTSTRNAKSASHSSSCKHRQATHHQTLFLRYPRPSPLMARRLPRLSQSKCGPKWSSLIPSSCPGWSSSRQCSGPSAFSGFHQCSLRLSVKSSSSFLMTHPSAVPSIIPQISKQQPLHSL